MRLNLEAENAMQMEARKKEVLDAIRAADPGMRLKT